MIIKDNYYDAINIIINKTEKLPEYLKPTSILWSGSINSPGISDIDLLIGFEDEFMFANEFLFEFKNITDEIENNHIFFFHKPAILPISSLTKLSKFTLNDFSKTEIIYGKNIFNQTHNQISNDQILINSMEFIHSRIINFLINIHKKNINLSKLLIEGHSFIHSLSSLKTIGAKIEKTEFENFNTIENYRKKIVNDEKVEISNSKVEELYKGICIEFYYLLHNLYQEFQKKVAAHYNKNINFHEYDESILLNNLAKNKLTNLSLNFKNNIFVIEGFSWELKCLFDNYFEDKNEYSTIFINKDFLNSITEKKIFLNNLYKFNFMNFGNSYGRSGIKPMISGKNLDRLIKTKF